MIGNALWIGTVLAIIIGLAHAVYVYRQEIGEFRAVLGRHPLAIRWRAVYHAIWTLLLWLLLGATVLLYWAIALVPYLIAKIIGVARLSRSQVSEGAGTSS